MLIDGKMTRAAMVNAVITATEAKVALLTERNMRTAEGFHATGTSTDSIVIACTNRGEPIPYVGPATRVGFLIGKCVRESLSLALDS